MGPFIREGSRKMPAKMSSSSTHFASPPARNRWTLSHSSTPSFLVVSMVGIVDVCLLGYMAHWNLDFNSVTAINVTIAVGLAVDYSAHVAHSFLVATGDRQQRVIHAIDHIGSSVANGAFTTFLAVLPLGASQS